MLIESMFSGRVSFHSFPTSTSGVLSSGLRNIGGGEDEGLPEVDVGNEWNETLPENIDSIIDLQEG